jgi:DNA adenine methylase
MEKITRPIMSYHGGKFRLAPWIQSFFPQHHTYVEPFGGAAGVILQKKRSMSEVYNDLDGDIVNVFRVLRDRKSAQELQRLLALTPYAREEFELSHSRTSDPVENARRVLIASAFGFGSAGATKNTTGFRIDGARRYGTSAHLWGEFPDLIMKFCERFKNVIIENKPAVEVIANHDRADTLFFVDPPYMHSTRNMGGNRGYYRHEMTDADHEELLNSLKTVKGFVVLSGYDNDLYREALGGWTKFSKTARISGVRGAALRLENVWLNPRCNMSKVQMRMFC